MTKKGGINEFVRALGGNVTDPRRSWGALRSDCSIILKVWMDRVRPQNGQQYVMVLHALKYEHGAPSSKNWAYNERKEHVEQIRGGAPCILVMQHPKGVEAEGEAREYLAHEEGYVYIGGDLKKFGGDWYIEMAHKVENPRSIYGVK